MSYQHHRRRLEIQELDIHTIPPSMHDVLYPETSKGGCKLTVIGRPGTGKSQLISSLIYAKRNVIPTAMVFSGTEDSNQHYRSMIPSTFIYNKLDLTKVENYIKRQKIAKKYLDNPWSMLIVDDCTDDPKIFGNPLIQNLYKNGRHYSCLYILALQYCMDIKPVIRTNVDGVFILREPTMRNRKQIWENYASIIPDFTMFCDIMDQVTNDYTALYINNRVNSNRLEDCIFWYRAPREIPAFRFGSDDYWKFHEDRYNPNYKDPFTV